MFRPGFDISQIVSQSIDLGKSPGDYINPKTGQKYTTSNVVSIIGDFINDYEKKMNEKTIDLKEKYDKEMPKFGSFNSNLPEQVKQFQLLTQNFIRDVPLQFKLDYFNKVQEECPYILADPLLRKRKGPITYGLADVYRFIGLPLQRVRIGKYKSRQPEYKPKVMPIYEDVHGRLQKNPLFAPVSYNYPIPDIKGNMALKQIYMNNPLSLFSKLKGMYKGLIQMKGGDTNSFNKVNDSLDKFYIKGNIKDMITLINHIFQKELDPFYLTNTLISKTVDGSEVYMPPMRDYFKKNINSMLFQLLMSHRLYEINKKPATDKLQITSPMMNEFMESYNNYDKNPMVVVSSHYKPIGSKKSSFKGPQKRKSKTKRKSRSRKY